MVSGRAEDRMPDARPCGKAVVDVFFTIAMLPTATSVVSTVLCTQLSWDALGVIPVLLAGEAAHNSLFLCARILCTVILVRLHLRNRCRENAIPVREEPETERKLGPRRLLGPLGLPWASSNLPLGPILGVSHH